MRPLQIIQSFDVFLQKYAQSFTAIIIGGAALSLMGVITRETQDIDVLDPILPKDILNLSQKFARLINQEGNFTLKSDWLNNGPESLKQNLPKAWLERTTLIFSGKALTLYALGRSDFLKAKLFAFCDREQDRGDCLLLNPSRLEILEAMDWIKEQDQHPGWPAHVESSLESLAKELGYEL